VIDFIDSQEAQGPDIMGRTEVTVFLVAMAILPFLQNMILKKGPRHYIPACTHNLSPKLQKNLWPRLFITYPKAYAKETPFMDFLLNSHILIPINYD